MNRLELEKKIKEANWAYWIENNPVISDFEYDKLIEDLKKIDPENALINAFSYAGSKRKIVHSKPMLSLDKAYSLEEVMKWARKCSRSDDEAILVMPKYDGLSGKFENGRLSSRGDGRLGQDYTDRLPLIKFMTNGKNKETLLGEMLISDEDFKKVFSHLKTKSGIPFKNQRNAAAGVIGCDDVEFYRKQNAEITFIDYDLISYETTLGKLEDQWESILASIQKLPYPMDGIVLKIKDPVQYEKLGCTEHSPRGSIAFKYTNLSKWTKLTGVEWSMGVNYIACIGKVDPIDISGTTIRNVKLQLTKPISSKTNSCISDGSLQIGDYVLVERAGDIIPHIKESKPGEIRTRVLISKCPFCGSQVLENVSSIECSNDDCEEKKVQRLLFAMTALGFKGAGEAFARNLLEKLGIHRIDQLLAVSRNDLAMHRCFGMKIADNFISEQKKVLAEANAVEVLTAFAIPGLGRMTAKLLIDSLGIDRIRSGSIAVDDLTKIKGIGAKVANDVISGLQRRKDEVEKTLALFEFRNCGEEEKICNKIRICFTGKMSKSRAEMERAAEEHGLFPVDHVDKDTNILVCADINSNSGKTKKAKSLGCRIISEEEFYKMLEK